MKRGISPLIATILIIGFTIILAALVMRWSGTLFTTTTTGTEETSEIAVTCVSDVKFIVQDACVVGEQINLLIKNQASDINGFIFQVISDTTTTTETTGLATYSSSSFLADYTGAPMDIQRVKIYPKINFQGKEQVCTEINYMPERIKSCDTLVENGDFESDLQGWTVSSEGEVSIDTTSYVTGIKSVKFYSDSVSGASVSSLDIVVTPGKEYVLSAWGKGSGLSEYGSGTLQENLGVIGVFLDSDGNPVDELDPTTYSSVSFPLGTYDWVKEETETTAPSIGAGYPKDARFFRLLVVGIDYGTTGTGWIDNVQFYEKS